MSGFASYSTGHSAFIRSPPPTRSQPTRTSPLKSSYVPNSAAASPATSAASSSGTDSDIADTTDLSDSDADESDGGDLVFFGTPTAKEAQSIARLSQAIPATPLPSTPTHTPSKRQRTTVRKRDSREFLRRQTIVHEPYAGTPSTSTKGKGKGKAVDASGRKIWPGGFFERSGRDVDEEADTDYAPTPSRYEVGAGKTRRATLSPTRQHDDCELTFDFDRLGLATPARFSDDGRTTRFQRERSTDLSEEEEFDASDRMHESYASLDFSAEEELADSDKENCPAANEGEEAEEAVPEAEQMEQELFEGAMTGGAYPFDEPSGELPLSPRYLIYPGG